ncbi:hypothetical protein GCM10010399_41720 [Dactylosporangium fulvum]|uniref:Uncharacterized protein n=1 Tax=Dactylosporangium fulvum TaxID=53359 RepID=A0ABY5W2S9_9ACTN|nr:hypothetical protein [Dactylosporangium fulvum]UWP82361.1 hypothetical protein Dfulv_46185 [Dactylosporangium fulvum]
MMRDDFDAAIGVVPPSPIDVDKVIARGRRRAVVRRLATVGSGGAATAAAVSAAVVLASGSTGGSGVGGPGGNGAGSNGAAVAAPSVVDSPGPPSGVGASGTSQPKGPVARDRANYVEMYLAQKLPQAITAHAPGVIIPAHAFNPKYMWTDTIASDGYRAEANLQLQGRSGRLVVNLGTRGPAFHPPNECFAQGETGPCNVHTEADGTKVLQRVTNANGIRSNFVIVDRPDGQAIVLGADNQGGQAGAGPGSQADPVLTLEQLVAIGRDSRLTAEPHSAVAGG